MSYPPDNMRSGNETPIAYFEVFNHALNKIFILFTLEMAQFSIFMIHGDGLVGGRSESQKK